jgi:hypothetical protein
MSQGLWSTHPVERRELSLMRGVYHFSPPRCSDVDCFAYKDSMAQDDRRRVYLYFQLRSGWQCQFLEQDLKIPLPRKLHFATSNKVVQLVERAGGFTDQESRLMRRTDIPTTVTADL